MVVAVALERMPASALQTVVPVATKISGSVAVQSPDGVHHEVVTSRLLRSGDTILTGPHSLASIDLADVGKVTIGPVSGALAQLTGSQLSVQLTSGLICVESQTTAVSVTLGAMRVWATAAPAIFSVKAGDESTVAVYRGNVAYTMHGAGLGTLHTGEAAVTMNEQSSTPASLASVNSKFASLHCPDQASIKEALNASTTPTAADAPAPPSGHGGGILGWLLGFAAIAAAAGGHGGSAGNAATTPSGQTGPGPSLSPSPSTSASATASPTPSSTATATSTPVPTSSPTPTPSPTPSSTSTSSPPTISVDPGSLSFSRAGGDAQNFRAEDPASRNYSATSSNLEVATVSLQDEHAHHATFSVKPAGQGTATISVADDAGGRGFVNIRVGSGDSLSMSSRSLACALTASANTLVFTGSMASQRLSAADSCSQSALHARSSDTRVATVNAGVSIGTVQYFLVIARSEGSAALTISDDRGAVVMVRVIVTVGPSRRLRSQR